MNLTERRIAFCASTIVLGSCVGMKADMIGGSTGRSLAIGLVLAAVVVLVATFAAWPWIGPEDDR